MKKDFDKWNTEKKKTDAREDVSNVYFDEREVWWTRLGVNVGYEQDGTGGDFERPVIIIKKYNPHTLLIVPLSTTSKRGTYYLPVGDVEGRDAVAILSQVRLIDSKRLINRADVLDIETFKKLVRAIVNANFGGYMVST